MSETTPRACETGPRALARVRRVEFILLLLKVNHTLSPLNLFAKLLASDACAHFAVLHTSHERAEPASDTNLLRKLREANFLCMYCANRKLCQPKNPRRLLNQHVAGSSAKRMGCLLIRRIHAAKRATRRSTRLCATPRVRQKFAHAIARDLRVRRDDRIR